jgi:hypothetical protein
MQTENRNPRLTDICRWLKTTVPNFMISEIKKTFGDLFNAHYYSLSVFDFCLVLALAFLPGGQGALKPYFTIPFSSECVIHILIFPEKLGLF